MPITALFAGLLALLAVFLTIRVIRVRRSERVEIGDGSRPELLRRMRVHANFVEHAPLALILMGLAESLRAPSGILVAIGVALLVGRVVHAIGLSATPHIIRMRVAGMALTLTATICAAVLCIGYGATAGAGLI